MSIPLDGKPPRARATHRTQGDYLNRRCLCTCLSVVSTPVVYHQAMSDHAQTQIIAKVMNAAFSPSSTCEHVSLNLKSACFVPCESCMAAAAVQLGSDRFSPFVLWCPMRQGRPSGACTVSGAVRLGVLSLPRLPAHYCFDGGVLLGRAPAALLSCVRV